MAKAANHPRSLFAKLRSDYLRSICKTIVARRKPTKKQKSKGRNKSYLNMADGDSRVSVDIADRLILNLGFRIGGAPPTEQTSGTRFTKITCDFIEKSFKATLCHLRPGDWHVTTRQPERLLAQYDQYSHLSELADLAEQYPQIASTLGREYFVKPDIVIGRKPATDSEINSSQDLVSDCPTVASFAPLREANYEATTKGKGEAPLILHATISCKWTLRSDRAQNSRTEALNLIRNRKGRTPHVVVVTMEPLPSRIASIALGTGDIDCTYHAALHELRQSLRECQHQDAEELLEDMIRSRRLRDVSDLPFDLAI